MLQQLTLDERHLRHLQDSAISDDIIAERGYVSITPGSIHDWRRVAGDIHRDDLLKRVLHQGALAFPLFRCAEETPYTWVLRPDLPRTSKEGKPIKYEYPSSTPNILDVLPRYRGALGNPEIDLWITEGCKKADSLASAYGEMIVPVNENGVWGWRSKGKLLDDFKRVVWEGRRVVLAPDGDVRHNKAVYQAVQRSARLFTAWGAAEVLILLLPNEKDGPKCGVDDYLAQGHTLDELESHLVELAVVGETARVSLMKHPQTGVPLFLPAGYDVLGKTIVRSGRDGQQALYSGLLAVTGTGRNLHSGDETATVIWSNSRGHHELDVSRAHMATTRGCAETLGTAGAAIHAMNAREVSRYLVEFIQENYDDLPRVDYADRLGAIASGGLVLPAGTIGLDAATKYTGTPVQVGSDPESYRRVLLQVLGDPTRGLEGWPNTVTLWAVLALGLASPALARLRAGRNPVLVLAGASGSGKTTLSHLAVGAYGDPTRSPLQIQCGSGTTTPKGIQQTLTQTNGVPIFLDDVHMLMEREPLRFAGLIYDFANGQLRTYGTLDQKGGGGGELGGTLVMAGEMVPEFQHAGSQKRVMLFDCAKSPPLGVPAETSEGKRRADLLDSAWSAGAGLFGLQICEAIWRDWGAFTADVARLQFDESIRDMQAWRSILATAAATLQVALGQLGQRRDVAPLLRAWAGIYRSGQRERDPAIEAFDKVLVMLSQCEVSDNATSDEKGRRIAASWRWLNYERKMVAAQRLGDSYWRVLTTSPQWRAIVGPGAVDQFGSAWLKAGLILPHKGQRPISDRVHTGPGRGNLQCILVPEAHFAPHDGGEEGEEIAP